MKIKQNNRILLLGGNGFLGKHLQKILEVNNQNVLVVTRSLNQQTLFPQLQTTSTDWLEQVEDFKPTTTINMLASWGNNLKEEELIASNFAIAEEVSFRVDPDSHHHWVQCNSYFNYYFDLTGEDKDQYSQLRRLFTEQLVANYNGNWGISELRLPHLVGMGQPEKQLLPNLINAVLLNEYFELSSGTQYIPTSTVEDVASDLLTVLSAASFVGHKQWNVQPTEQMTLREISAVIQEVVGNPGKLNFGAISDRTKEFYSPIMFIGSEISPSVFPRKYIKQVVEEYLNVRKTG